MGEILSRFEKAGFKAIGMKMKWVDTEFAKQHYVELVEKPFYPGLEKYIQEGPVLAIAFEGVAAIENVRKIVGSTEPKGSAPGTIRGDYAHSSYAYSDDKGISLKNLIHASGNKEDAEREVALWFSKEELHTYKTVHDAHILD